MRLLWSKRRCGCCLSNDGKEAICNHLPEVDARGEDMTKRRAEAKAVKRPAKSKSARDLPVTAWEKLKGRGPYPSVALDEEFKKKLEKM